MKRGPKGDTNPQKGPLGDLGPLKGTHCVTVYNPIIRYNPIILYNHCYTIKRGPKNPKKGTQRGPNFEQKGDQKGTQIT